MKRIFALLLCATTALVAPSPMAAEDRDQCPAASTIVSLANGILDGREGLRRSEARRFGTDAAYMLIHYGGLDDAAITALLDRITREGLIRADELARAYRISTGSYGVEDIRKDWHTMGPPLSIWRALILTDDGTRYLKLVREMGAVRASHGIQPTFDMIPYEATRALADTSDEARATVVATAIRMGEIEVALTLLADQSDLTAFYDLAAQYPRNRLMLDDRWFPKNYRASLRQQSEPIDLGHDIGAFRTEFRKRMFEIGKADYRLGTFGFLGTFLNLTGKEHFVSDVAAALNDAIDEGWLDPVKRPDQAWISAYRQLVERMGHSAVDEGMMFERALRRHTDGQTVRDTTHTAIAAQALAGYIVGDSDALPDRPRLLSPETPVDWQAWGRVAGVLRRGQAEAMTDQADIMIGVELAFAAGQHDTAIALASRVQPQARVLRIHTDLMKRLDQGCAGHGWEPGPSFGQHGTSLYRFPASR